MILLVLSTFPDEESAAVAARTLVEENLAACGTIIPGVRSIYRWQGAIEDAREVLVIFKTPRESEPLLRARLAALHPYEVPEIVGLEPDSIHEPYARWVLSFQP